MDKQQAARDICPECGELGHTSCYNAGYQAAQAALMPVLANTAHLLSDMMSFAQHDEDCHINNWGDNQIPECTCGYTYKSQAAIEALARLNAIIGEK